MELRKMPEGVSGQRGEFPDFDDQVPEEKTRPGLLKPC